MAVAKKIFVGNYKGGVGKTTSIYQIALHMVQEGKRVLLIDLDPQCSLSEICLKRIDKHIDELADHECLNYIYDLWNEFKLFPNIQVHIQTNELVKQTDTGIHFIPSNIFYRKGGLDELSMTLKGEFEDLLVLQQFFQKNNLEEQFDYILFDCPPSNNVITQGAFLLSDYYVIPTIIQTLSIRGVVHYISTVEKIYHRYCEDHEKSILSKALFGNKPRLIGLFETMKKGTVNNSTEIQELNDSLADVNIESICSELDEQNYVFNTIIGHYEGIARDTAVGKICTEYADLTFELLEYIEN